MKQYILTITHNIFLNDEQRELIAKGESVEVTGVSLPVWICKDQKNKRGFTTEPALEVFCKYRLTNVPRPKVVCRTQEGYQINLPQLPKGYKEPERISNDDWRKMSKAQQQSWYEKNRRPPTGENLKGKHGRLSWKEVGQEKIGDKTVDIMNYIVIDQMNSLTTTIEQN